MGGTVTSAVIVRTSLHTAPRSTSVARRRPTVTGGPWKSPTYADSTINDNVDGEDLEIRRAAVEALPASLKIKNGRRKHVLKEVAARLLPEGIVDRKKQGFGVPLGTWFRGDLKELFADTLLAPTTLQRGYFEPRFVRRIVNEHLAGRRDHTLRLWQLVVFERWHRQYVDGRLAVRPARAASLG